MKATELENMKPQWVLIYANRTRCTPEKAEAAFRREAQFFETQTENTPDLKGCTEISLKNTFLNIAACGLSIQQDSKAVAFLQARSFKKGQDERGNIVWGKACSLTVTAYGERDMRIMSGQIKAVSNPQVIYEGDHFQPKTNENGDLVVDYQPAIPRKSKKIIGCYVQLVLPNGRRDYKWLLEEDFKRLAAYSEKANKGKANALYSSDGGQIDPGFAEAKTLKAAFRAYSKVYVEGTDDTVSFADDEFDEQEAAEAQQPFGETPAGPGPDDTVTHAGGEDDGMF